MTRRAPNSSIRPSVTRKTPPSTPTSSPSTTTSSSALIAWWSARFSASIMVRSGIVVALFRIGTELVLLSLEVGRLLCVDVVEHRRRITQLRHLLVGGVPRLVDLVGYPVVEVVGG